MGNKKRCFLLPILFGIVFWGIGTSNISADNSINEQLNTTSQIQTDETSKGSADLSDGVNTLEGKQNNNDLHTFAAKPAVTTVKYHTSENLVGNKFRVYVWIDKISGPAPVAGAAKLQFYTKTTMNGKTSVTNAKTITKAGVLKAGQFGYVDFPAKTTYFFTTAAFGMTLLDGTSGFGPVSKSGLYLQNKKAQNFPVYVDPISKKDDVTTVATNWKRTTPRTWTTYDRRDYIAAYSRKYGNQPSNFWPTVEIHHIRPRAQGGNNNFENLMPVPKSTHQLITKWFVNY